MLGCCRARPGRSAKLGARPSGRPFPYPFAYPAGVSVIVSSAGVLGFERSLTDQVTLDGWCGIVTSGHGARTSKSSSSGTRLAGLCATQPPVRSRAGQKKSAVPDRIENGIGLIADRGAGVICKPRRVVGRKVLACHVRGECSDSKFRGCMKAVDFHGQDIPPKRVHDDINRKYSSLK